MLAPLRLLVLVLACAPASVGPTLAPTPTPAAAEIAAPRVVVLVRHAEKLDETRDAALSPVGHARAACLAKVLADLALTHVFSTEFQRTRDTIAPLVSAQSLTPAVIAADATDAWVERLRGLAPGSIALVAGHSNSLPKLIAALGAGEITIAHDAYDWMFVVTLASQGAPTLLRTHYCPV